MDKYIINCGNVYFARCGGAISGRNKLKKFVFLNKIGKISYDIFLVQMVYYNFGANAILDEVFHNIYIVCIINVLACISVGAVYARIERRIVHKLLNRKFNRKRM